MMQGAPVDRPRVPVAQTVDDLVGDLACTAQDIRFPEAQDNPARCVERTSLVTITFDISFHLRNPVGRVVSSRELREAGLKVTAVPEVSIAENYEAVLREDDVRAARQAGVVEPIAQPPTPEFTT